MKKFKLKESLIGLTALIAMGGCQKGDLTSNPNIGSTASASLLLNTISVRFYNGGGVMNAETGNVPEAFWGNEYKYGQYYLSNYAYYQGTNAYNWSYSATSYNLYSYVLDLEKRAASELAASPTSNPNKAYPALAKFYKAYALIWYAQRVGDIPMTEAGDPNNLTPKFDTQKDVFKASLALLDDANTILGNTIASGASGVVDATGDIFGLTYLQWQKIVNAYKLRVLISLSKRAVDNADLNIPAQFATIVSDPAGHPLPTSNSDNLVYKYNSVNPYPAYNTTSTNQYANINKTYLDLTTSYQDPRTFVTATPAPAQLTAGKQVSDFTAYVGASPNLDLGGLANGGAPATSPYSYLNYRRYGTSNTGANTEPYVLIGYPELCFNIAEGINRGWASGSAADWYNKGIDASLNTYGITEGQSITIGNFNNSTVLGTVTANVAAFKANVAYQGGTTGLRQILEQKYVALFLNSNWESYYNWRRTGVPAFIQGGAGIGTSNGNIPRRWQYPVATTTENATNYNAALQSQGFSSDDVSLDTWLTK